MCPSGFLIQLLLQQFQEACYQNTVFTFSPSGSDGPKCLLVRNWMHSNSTDTGSACGDGNERDPGSGTGERKQGWQFGSSLPNPGRDPYLAQSRKPCSRKVGERSRESMIKASS